MPAAVRDAVGSVTANQAGRRSRRLGEHLPFLVALVLGAAVRVVVSSGFTPALMISDGPTYLAFLDTFAPDTDRPVGYGVLLLYPVSVFTEAVAAVTVVQHVLGLATACLIYALLRRWGVGRWPATLATLPVLFDAMQLILEHAPLSDTLFVLLVTLGVVVLGWRRRPTTTLALAAGLVLGASVTVRQVGLPLVLTATAFCLLAGQGWRGRLTPAVALVVAFFLPVGAYATWYQAEHGVFALSEIGGKSSYMRTTTFVDCSGLTLPEYQRVLCPPEPRGERLDPTTYGWHDARTVPRLDPPAGTTTDEAMREFAAEAVRAQPLDYVLAVGRDFALNFDPSRGNRFEFDTAFKWRFSTYLDRPPTTWTGPAYENHGGEQLNVHQPYADLMVGYQRFGYLPGPLLLGCLVLGLLGGLGVGRAKGSGVRSMCLLLTLSGAGLLLVPDVTTQFVWRYQLPALVLLPAGAALAVTALRGRRQPAVGTVATPSTD